MINSNTQSDDRLRRWLDEQLCAWIQTNYGGAELERLVASGTVQAALYELESAYSNVETTLPRSCRTGHQDVFEAIDIEPIVLRHDNNEPLAATRIGGVPR